MENQEYEEMVANVSEAMGKIKNKIAVISGKGGVGKTTVSVNLACSLAKKFKVGLLDTDITGPNVPKMMGLDKRKLISNGDGIIPAENQGVKVMSMAFLLEDKDTPVVWRGPLRGNLILQFLSDVQWGDLDYLIIDLPPGTGDEALTVAQMLPGITGAVIVTTPQDVALMDSRKAVNFSKKVGMPVLGIIENMSGLDCPHCGNNINLFGSGGGERAAKEVDVPFIGRLPLDPEVVSSGDSGKSFMIENPKTDLGTSFQQIVEKIIGGE
ncbi:MAG: P-loop NTPase [Candidatus Altiarchaeales archaeon]|nr:P-loop NTPase [Candidatus Altiarchaeales archaeon]MBD3417323.1 P-loop NTPase [Candidatus Altiarchaeales archaeon]